MRARRPVLNLRAVYGSVCELAEFLFRQAEPGTSLAVVLDGTFEVRVNGQTVGQVGPGTVAGERAALQDGRRTADLRALTQARVAETAPGTFHRRAAQRAGPVPPPRGQHSGPMTAPPETRYARNRTIHRAYQVLGSGPPNLLVVQSGPNSHVDWNWMQPSLARFIRRLASFSRLVMYDNRGVGLSDPVPGGAAPTMDEQVDDIRAILDEAGCQRAVLAGNLAGCAPALVFAATHPGRVESLVLLGGYARLRAGAGYPPALLHRQRRPGAGCHRGSS